MTHVEIRVLGAFEVSVDGHPVEGQAWRHRRATELVQILALAPRHRLHREQIIDLLWSGLRPEAGGANLRKAAHYARAAIGAPDAVVLRGDQVGLWPSAEVSVDAKRFESHAEAALRAGDPDVSAEAAALYGGELLPEQRYESWAEEPRQRLRSLYLRLLGRSGLWERVAIEEPTDEAACQMLMRMYADAGNRSAALEQFHALHAALAAIGLEPSEETQALFREIAHAPLRTSPIRFVRSGGVSIAFQVVEGRPADLLMIPGWVSHLELDWEEPNWVRWCERMTAFARLLRFDKRGTGLSDRPPGVQPPDERMRDALAVLDAAGLEHAHVMGWSEGGPLAVRLAASRPERALSLVLYGTQASFQRDADYPWGHSAEERGQVLHEIEQAWGKRAFVERFAPSAGRAFADRWAAYQRAGASPSAVLALARANLEVNVRPLLAEIRAPTLVLSRRGDPVGPPDAARYMAERIPGARFVELEGNDHVPWVGDVEALCGEIERFVLDVEARVAAGNVSGTVAS